MDTVLLIVALVSAGAAVGLGVVAWRVTREQQLRSAARVATLAGAIRPGDDMTAPVAVASLFDKGSGAMMQGRPLIKAAVVAVLGVGLIVYVTMATSREIVDSERQPDTVAADATPLELMTMRHVRRGETLTVTGLVRNPSGGSQVSKLTAVLLAFDRTGTFVATGQAPLDFTILAPGDESPFVVTLPNAAEVSRYRVSFRSDAGAVVRHLDRRTASEVARVN